MKYVVIRKLIAGVVALLLAIGVIRVELIQETNWLRRSLYVLGILLILASMLYQFDLIPESSTDALFK